MDIPATVAMGNHTYLPTVKKSKAIMSFLLKKIHIFILG